MRSSTVHFNESLSDTLASFDKFNNEADSLPSNTSESAETHHVVKKADVVDPDNAVVHINDVNLEEDIVVEEEAELDSSDSAEDDGNLPDDSFLIEDVHSNILSRAINLLGWDTEQRRDISEEGEAASDEKGSKGGEESIVAPSAVESDQSLDEENVNNANDNEETSELDSIVDLFITNNNPLNAVDPIRNMDKIEPDAEIEAAGDGKIVTSVDGSDTEIIEDLILAADQFSSFEDKPPQPSQDEEKLKFPSPFGSNGIFGDSPQKDSYDEQLVIDAAEPESFFVDPSNWPLLPPVQENNDKDKLGPVVEIIMVVPFDDVQTQNQHASSNSKVG